MSIRRPASAPSDVRLLHVLPNTGSRLSVPPLWVFTLTLPAPEAEGGRRARQITQKVSFPSTSSFFLFCSDCLLLLSTSSSRLECTRFLLHGMGGGENRLRATPSLFSLVSRYNLDVNAVTHP